MSKETSHTKFFAIAGNPPRLIGRELSALKKEEWGPVAKRPWVHMWDPHLAIEKALWCYERGMVPVITERDPALALAIAKRYDADLLIVDAYSLSVLGANLDAVPSVRSVVVFGERTEALERLLSGKVVQFVAA